MGIVFLVLNCMESLLTLSYSLASFSRASRASVSSSLAMVIEEEKIELPMLWEQRTTAQ